MAPETPENPMSFEEKMIHILRILKKYPSTVNLDTLINQLKPTFNDEIEISQLINHLVSEKMIERHMMPQMPIGIKIEGKIYLRNWEEREKKTIQDRQIESDSRIQGRLSKEEVEKYWMQLTDLQVKKGVRKQVLTDEEVMYLLQANFYGFEQQVPFKMFKTPDLKINALTRFVHIFYEKPCKHVNFKYLIKLHSHYQEFHFQNCLNIPELFLQ
ncbi:MAG TPA: hypothetical protein VJY62_08110 [Bacteroidia bacterium]|nr:hypothetical protein [Bacteroidia bacterium]